VTKKINIGITILIEDFKTTTLFSNGIRQNVISLRDLFEKCKNVNKSYIINTSNKNSEISNSSLQKYTQHIISKEQAKEKCDLIVVCHGSLNNAEITEFKSLGKKIVKHILGAELAALNERILFNGQPSGIFEKNDNVSAVWISPHYYHRDRFLFETLFSCPTHIAPYIWTPEFISNSVANLQKDGWSGKYTPSEEPSKRISVMEPNLSIVKTSIIPILTAELLERKSPELLKFVSIFGGEKIKDKKDLIDLMKNLSIQKNKKCFFEARYPIVWTLKEHTDIVLSHQNQNELNYLYLDAAWLGYPVVHNSPMMKELGWYYSENNCDAAIKHIEYIAKNFDTNEYIDDKYLIKSRAYVSQFLPDNPKNIKGYEKLINSVYAEKLK
jgi:Protein of unknown function (DUF2827)